MRVRALGALLLAGTLARADVQVRALVDADTIAVDDQLQLTIEVTGEGMLGDLQVPHVPQLSNLRVAAGPSTSTSFRWVNGQTSTSKSFIWVLLPLKEGVAQIPSVEVEVGQRLFRTEPLQVTIAPPGSAPSGGSPGSAMGRRMRIPRVIPGAPWDDRGDDVGGEGQAGKYQVVVRADTDLASPFVGQPVVLTYRLLTQVPIAQVAPEQPPAMEGFLVDEIDVKPAETRKRVVERGVTFDEYVLGERILTPTEPGKKTIGPAIFRITASLPTRDLFGRMFGSGMMQELARQTEPIVLDVRPLPGTGKPADFSGAIGSFALKVAADRGEATTGDAVGLKVTVEGTGDLRTATPPGLPPLHDMRVYEPKMEEKTDAQPGARHTSRTWSYVVVPLAPGEQVIPAIRFAYFDPQREAYQVASAGPTVLNVHRGASVGETPAPVSRQEVTALRRDLNYLKGLDTPLLTQAAPLYRQGKYWLLVLLPLAAPVVVSLLLALAAPGAPERTRRRRSARHVRRMLRRAAAAGSAGKESEFYDAVSSALVCGLALQWGVPSAGLTYEQIESELARRGVSPEARERCRRLLERCDSYRFAPASAELGGPGGADGATALIAQARDLISLIERQSGWRPARTAGPADSRIVEQG